MEFPKQGSIVVFEGPDRCGKSTQIKLCAEILKTMGIKVKCLSFPDRTSETGKIIDEILKSKKKINPEALHLLFSSNRWEKSTEISNLIKKGYAVLIDRYFHSGLVYSCASGLDPEWCASADSGLPIPSLVLYLEVDPESFSKRGGFGDELFEKIDFQKRVVYFYEKFLLPKNFCKKINGNLNVKTVTQSCVSEILKIQNLNIC